MSLVVAMKKRESLFLVGDTKLTLKTEPKALSTQGIIKTQILHPNLCVGFAGNTEYAGEAIRSLHAASLLNGERSKVVGHFLNWQRKSRLEPESVDFVLAFSDPELALVKVSEGAAQECDEAWLGSAPAYDCFRRCSTPVHVVSPSNNTTPVQTPNLWCWELRILRSGQGETYPEVGLIPPEDAAKFKLMKEAMADVVTRGIESVGDFVTTVAYVRDGTNVGLSKGYNFIDYFDSRESKLVFEASSNFPSIYFGTAEKGACTRYFMRAIARDGEQYPSMYFPQASIGLLFLSDSSGLLRSITIRDSEKEDFCSIAAARYAIRIPSWPGRRFRIVPGQQPNAIPSIASSH